MNSDVQQDTAVLAAVPPHADSHSVAAAHAVLDGDEVLLAGAISSPDGAVLLRGEQRSADGPDLGRALARHLLDERGGSALLESA